MPQPYHIRRRFRLITSGFLTFLTLIMAQTVTLFLLAVKFNQLSTTQEIHGLGEYFWSVPTAQAISSAFLISIAAVTVRMLGAPFRRIRWQRECSPTPFIVLSFLGPMFVAATGVYTACVMDMEKEELEERGEAFYHRALMGGGAAQAAIGIPWTAGMGVVYFGTSCLGWAPIELARDYLGYPL